MMRAKEWRKDSALSCADVPSSKTNTWGQRTPQYTDTFNFPGQSMGIWPLCGEGITEKTQPLTKVALDRTNWEISP